jgi:hypothetical protein
MTGPGGDLTPGGRRLWRPPSVVMASGPYQGMWLRYRPRAKAARAHLGTCDHCGQGTLNVGTAGWFYRRAELGDPRRQRCPRCLAALRAGG